MPIYEYECTSCHHHFELMQKINDEAVKQCPVCYQITVVKNISAAGFQLKGSGWYATDFKNKSNKPTEATPTNNDSASTDKTKDTSLPKNTQDGDIK